MYTPTSNFIDFFVENDVLYFVGSKKVKGFFYIQLEEIKSIIPELFNLQNQLNGLNIFMIWNFQEKIFNIFFSSKKNKKKNDFLELKKKILTFLNQFSKKICFQIGKSLIKDFFYYLNHENMNFDKLAVSEKEEFISIKNLENNFVEYFYSPYFENNKITPENIFWLKNFLESFKCHFFFMFEIQKKRVLNFLCFVKSICFEDLRKISFSIENLIHFGYKPKKKQSISSYLDIMRQKIPRLTQSLSENTINHIFLDQVKYSISNLVEDNQYTTNFLKSLSNRNISYYYSNQNVIEIKNRSIIIIIYQKSYLNTIESLLIEKYRNYNKIYLVFDDSNILKTIKCMLPKQLEKIIILYIKNIEKIISDFEN